MLDDVADLLGVQPEVDRYQHPAVTADSVEQDPEPGRVGAHDRDSLTEPDTHPVQSYRNAASPAFQGAVGDGAERASRARLVDQRGPVTVDQGATAQEIGNCQRHLHGRLPWLDRFSDLASVRASQATEQPASAPSMCQHGANAAC